MEEVDGEQGSGRKGDRGRGGQGKGDEERAEGERGTAGREEGGRTETGRAHSLAKAIVSAAPSLGMGAEVHAVSAARLVVDITQANAVVSGHRA